MQSHTRPKVCKHEGCGGIPCCLHRLPQSAANKVTPQRFCPIGSDIQSSDNNEHTSETRLYNGLTRVSVLPMRLRSTEATDATNIGLVHDLASCPIALLDSFATTASRFKTPSIKLVPSLHSSPSVAPFAPSSVARIGCQPRTKFTGPKRIYHGCIEVFGSVARRAALCPWPTRQGAHQGIRHCVHKHIRDQRRRPTALAGADPIHVGSKSLRDAEWQRQSISTRAATYHDRGVPCVYPQQGTHRGADRRPDQHDHDGERRQKPELQQTLQRESTSESRDRETGAKEPDDLFHQTECLVRRLKSNIE